MQTLEGPQKRMETELWMSTADVDKVYMTYSYLTLAIGGYLHSPTVASIH